MPSSVTFSEGAICAPCAANTCLAQAYIAEAKPCWHVYTISPEAVQKAGYPGQGLNVQSDPSSTVIVRNGSTPCRSPPYCNCRRVPERSVNPPVPFELMFTTTLDKPGKVVWRGKRGMSQFSGLASSEAIPVQHFSMPLSVGFGEESTMTPVTAIRRVLACKNFRFLRRSQTVPSPFLRSRNR